MRLPHPHRPEAALVQHHLQRLHQALDWPAVAHTARPWVEAVRRHPPPLWALETLLQEYPISSAEGLALMRLAEALLRVPDADTALALTADQLGRADFSGSGEAPLARLSSAVIALSKKCLPEEGSPPGLAARLGAQAVVAATVRAVQLLGRQFVLGQDIEQALQAAQRTHAEQARVCFSFDMLGEGARTQTDAGHHLHSYRHALAQIAARLPPPVPTGPGLIPCTGRDGLSIKLSALHPRYEHAQRERVLKDLVPRLVSLCTHAAQAHINLTIDAEESERLELSLDVFEAVLAQIAPLHPRWSGFGLALQAYQGRALDLVNHVVGLARQHRLRLMCRLVKGAYWDTEVKRAQEAGLRHYPVFTHKHHTDISYLACAQALLAAPDAVFPQFATHNATTVAALLHLSRTQGANLELQRLHGMGEGLYREVLADPQAAHLGCRVYAPVGQHRDLLAYLVRRLLENGANTSFVHQLADATVSAELLLASPLYLTPTPALPLPEALWGPERANSLGLDLSIDSDRAPLLAALAHTAVPTVSATPLAAVNATVARAVKAQRGWDDAPVGQRAQSLRDTADALQHQLPTFAALLVQEAAKTWADAIGEVREAIDFLRYNAAQATQVLAPQTMPVGGPGITGEHNELRLRGRGAWVCISPWNFPLAIFTSQVASALVTGNSVLAKPAEQTPGVAQALVGLLHQHGVPPEVLQLCHGPGSTLGAALVAHPEIAGVAFTGSTAVSRQIQRQLAAKDGPIVPLLAETGGINAMVVDPSALPEQVVDAVVQSAFRSAGQRCSALRLLCVHEAVADRVIALVQGAAAELHCGDQAAWHTDVGPVIDEAAAQRLHAHLNRLRHSARPLLPPPGERGRLIPPQAFELDRIGALHEEVFGPVLHIVRWRGDPLCVIDQINALGHGLTLGIQTRIDRRAQRMAQRARVGNVYVNRSMVGAVVGLQPFGGEGLSGTGPKTGGPHYLLRFCSEQTLSINTAAAGGNAALLATLRPTR